MTTLQEIELTDRHVQQFWARVPDAGGMECWPWQGTIHRSGYGAFSCGNGQVTPRTRRAHRVSFFLRYGCLPPEGMHLDHLCRNRCCVNPAHLEPVTPKENNLRGNSPTSKIHLRSHCSNGHPFEGRNLVLIKHRRGHMYRNCRQCRLDNMNRHRQRAREKKLEQLSQEQSAVGGIEKQWTIAMSDNFCFDIMPAGPRRNGMFGSDADLNGTFPTKLAALDAHIAAQEEIRSTLNVQIHRAKRMRRRLALRTHILAEEQKP